MTMRSIHVLLFVFLGVMITSLVIAHPGSLDSEDCHRCTTDCDLYGLTQNSRHCHPDDDYTKTTSPESNTKDNVDWDSSVISVGEDCGRCQDAANQYCGSDGKCHCREGMQREENNKECVNNDHYCQGMDGRYAERDDENNKCGCKDGYAVNAEYGFDDCAHVDTICKEIHGRFVEGDDEGNCYCRKGYSFTPDGASCTNASSYLDDEMPETLHDGAKITGQRINNLIDTENRDRILGLLRKYFEQNDNAKAQLARYFWQLIQDNA